MPLQQAITDFGADVPFGQIPKKLLEHHGVSVPVGSTLGITQAHAQHVLDEQSLETDFRDGTAAATLIAQIDGSMIPTVETMPSEGNTEKVDRRKTRKIRWKEARLGFTRTPEQQRQYIQFH
jgi:hypothetical protein